MLERFEHIIYGNTIGALTFVLPDEGSVYEQLTTFKVVKNSFSLISNTNYFKKVDVEKVDTLLIIFIGNSQNHKIFEIKDSIDQSLFEKTLLNSFNMSWMNISDKIVSGHIDENQFLKLLKLKNNYIKDHHFLAIGTLGLENLQSLGLIEFDSFESLISQNKVIEFDLNEEKYDLIGANALGLVGSIFTQKKLQTKDGYRNDKNVLKSFAKRILFKMVPIVLIIMVLNYFYVNNLNSEITKIQYESSLISNLIGEKELTQDVITQDLKYFDQLASSLRVERSNIYNDLIDSHVKGIIYLKIIIDPSNIEDFKDPINLGKGSIWFETRNTDLINSWVQKIKNKDKFYNVELVELNTTNKGLSKGYISFAYE